MLLIWLLMVQWLYFYVCSKRVRGDRLKNKILLFYIFYKKYYNMRSRCVCVLIFGLNIEKKKTFFYILINYTSYIIVYIIYYNTPYRKLIFFKTRNIWIRVLEGRFFILLHLHVGTVTSFYTLRHCIWGELYVGLSRLSCSNR